MNALIALIMRHRLTNIGHVEDQNVILEKLLTAILIRQMSESYFKKIKA